MLRLCSFTARILNYGYPRLKKHLEEAKRESELDKARKRGPDGTITPEEIMNELDGPGLWASVRKQSIEEDYDSVVRSLEPQRQRKREAARTLLRVIQRARV